MEYEQPTQKPYIDKEQSAPVTNAMKIMSGNFCNVLGYPPCLLDDFGPSSMERIAERIVARSRLQK